MLPPGKFTVWGILGAVSIGVTVFGVFILQEFSSFFHISEELAQAPPDSALYEFVNIAEEQAIQQSAMLTSAVWGATVAGMYGVGQGLLEGRSKQIAIRCLGGILGGGMLAVFMPVTGDWLARVFIGEGIDSRMPNSSQDFQILMRTGIEQFSLIFAISLAVFFTVNMPIHDQRRLRKQLISALMVSLLAVSFFHAVSAIALPLAPFDDPLPDSSIQRWFFSSIVAVLLGFSLIRERCRE